MKSQSYRPDISEMPPYRLGRHWNTIQAYLIPGLEDDIGELSEELKKFMGICELLIDEKMFAKYRWRGNGRPPSSRISLFKAYILKAMRNYPYTKTLIAAVRESPTVRRLCGWESVTDGICDINLVVPRPALHDAVNGNAGRVCDNCDRRRAYHHEWFFHFACSFRVWV